MDIMMHSVVGINHLKSIPTSLVDLTEVKSIDFEFFTKSLFYSSKFHFAHCTGEEYTQNNGQILSYC